MKQTTTWLILILLSFNLFGQYEVIENINKKTKIVTFQDELYGLEYMGNLVVPTEYSELYALTYGKDPLLYISKNELFGVIRTDGSEILPIEYSAIDDQGSYFLLVKKGKNGILGHDGKIIVPAIYDKLEDLEGYGFILEKDGKTGVANPKGEIIVPIQYLSARVCNYDDLAFEVKTTDNRFVYIENQVNPTLIPFNDFDAVSNSLYAKTNELSIADWFAFLTDIGNYNADISINDLLPDTTKVEKKLLPIYRILFSELTNEEDSNRKYFSYKFKKYKQEIAIIDIKINEDLYNSKLQPMLDFPVTGITYEQTLEYLKWLNLKYETECTNGTHTAVFRLPTTEEWEKMALKGISEEMQVKKCLDSMNVKGCMLFIYKDLPKCSNYEDYLKYSFGEGTVSTKKLNPSLVGLFSIFGNVAEMTNQKGICKGGSFAHTASEAKTDNTITYTGAESWLGVRIVVEMKCME